MRTLTPQLHSHCSGITWSPTELHFSSYIPRKSWEVYETSTSRGHGDSYSLPICACLPVGPSTYTTLDTDSYSWPISPDGNRMCCGVSKVQRNYFSSKPNLFHWSVIPYFVFYCFPGHNMGKQKWEISTLTGGAVPKLLIMHICSATTYHHIANHTGQTFYMDNFLMTQYILNLLWSAV